MDVQFGEYLVSDLLRLPHKVPSLIFDKLHSLNFEYT